MKTKLLLITILFSASTNLWSQLAEGFETWEKNATSPPYNWEYPEGWSTSNPVTEFKGFSVLKSDEAYSGSFAALIKSVDIFDTYRPGVLLLGNANYTYSNLSIATLDGYDLQLIPNLLKGWYKFESDDPNTRGFVEVSVFRHNETTQTDSTIFISTYELSPVSVYSPFEFLISYFIAIDPEQDKLSLAFYSNRPQDIAYASSLWIDDVTLDFISSSQTIGTSGSGITLAPNPVQTGEKMQILFSQSTTKSERISICNASGQLISQFILPANEISYEVETKTLSPGWYSLQSANGLLGVFLVNK